MLRTWGFYTAAVLAAAALALLVVGQTTPAVIVAIGSVLCAAVAGVVQPRRGDGDAGPPLDPDTMGRLRTLRAQAGEVAAVRHLRSLRPGLTLSEATRLVRQL